MADRLRLHAAAVIVMGVSLLLGPAGQASAVETWTCWSGTGVDHNGLTVHLTRCRLAGAHETVDFGSSGSVPVVLRPNVGSDGDGLCWYWTSRDSHWVLLGVDDQRVATLGIDPDGVPGGPVIIDAAYPPCTSEPPEAPTALHEAWELLRQYVHPLPGPTIDPPPGSGLTGLATFVADTPPPAWSASIVSPHSGRTLEVETFVHAIEIEWGDGMTDTVPAGAFGLLTGWPDGAFGHIYETKTCPDPGGTRCHPTLTAYPLTVSYRWVARYRMDGGPWQPLPVSPTTTTIPYDLDELRPLRTAVG